MDDETLTARSIRGFGEMFAALAGGIGGPEAVIRAPNAVGARLERPDLNPFFDSTVVPAGVDPPEDDARLPHYVWAESATVPGRVEEEPSAIPCMGAWLDRVTAPATSRTMTVEPAPFGTLGDMNERAYGETGFLPIARAIRDPRAQAHGVRERGELVSVAMTLEVDSDLGIHYVVTRESHRGRGLASGLVGALLLDAAARGLTSATLQASEEGRRVWERLGFRVLTTLRAYVRPVSDGST